MRSTENILKAVLHVFCKRILLGVGLFIFILVSGLGQASGSGLEEIKEKGVLRHLGVPYAHFVINKDKGLDVELVRLFADYLGVDYEYIPSTWSEAIPALTGKQIRPVGKEIRVLGKVPIKGDILANGLTVLPWREKIVNYSVPTFVTQVWLIAAADSTLKPIQPSGDIDQDIRATKDVLPGHSLLGKPGTCLDPSLYGLQVDRIDIRKFSGSLNDLAPAVIKGEAELTLLDVPDALVALQKWPGEIKVIGPISRAQDMGVAFRQQDRELRKTFNRFFKKCRTNGTYGQLINKYYPGITEYFPDFF